MKRLLHITTVPHTLHFLIGQLSFMRRQGLDVEVASSAGDKLDFFLQHEPIKHHTVEMSRSLSPLRDLVSLIRLVRLILSRRPDIVHAHTPKAGMLAMIAAWFCRVPVRVYHIHGLRFATLTGWKRRLLVACERLACSLATQVLCVSPSARKMAIANRLVAPKNIKVLLDGSINGMDSANRFDPCQFSHEAQATIRTELGIPQDAVVIGFLGRLVRDKGIEELAAAWKTIREEQPTAHLLVVGDHESQDPVSATARETLESDKRIHRIGYDSNTPRLFAAMDVFCLPSYREGLPYVILEASSMSLPVVSTRVTGCVDAIKDGVTGTLVSPQDPDALAHAIMRYVLDKSLRTWHGAAGRRHIVENFQPASMWQALHEEYESLLGESLGDKKTSHIKKSAA